MRRPANGGQQCQSALEINPGSALNIDPARDGGSGAIVMSLDGSGPVFDAPTLVAGLDDVTVMGQPFQQRGCHARPFAKGEVRGDEDRSLLVEPTDMGRNDSRFK